MEKAGQVISKESAAEGLEILKRVEALSPEEKKKLIVFLDGAAFAKSLQAGESA